MIEMYDKGQEGEKRQEIGRWEEVEGLERMSRDKVLSLYRPSMTSFSFIVCLSMMGDIER